VSNNMLAQRNVHFPISFRLNSVGSWNWRVLETRCLEQLDLQLDFVLLSTPLPDTSLWKSQMVEMSRNKVMIFLIASGLDKTWTFNVCTVGPMDVPVWKSNTLLGESV
jgi:hypothetical protein